MSFGERLKSVRKQNNYTQEELANKLEYKKSTISEYEKDTNKPNYDTLIKICKIFKRDANYFLQDDIGKIPVKLNAEDKEVLDRYSSLTPHDKQIVDYILSMPKEKQGKETIKESIKVIRIIETNEVVSLPVFEQSAAAGIAEETQSQRDEQNTIDFLKTKVPDDATHGVIIEGDSMQPDFVNGQIVFIDASKECRVGDFGIFSVTTGEKTKIYCKKFLIDNKGRWILHSTNPNAEDPEIHRIDGTFIKHIGRIVTKKRHPQL